MAAGRISIFDSDDYFEPNQGGAPVYTVAHKGYVQQCPNVARLLENLVFSLDMENQLRDRVLNEKDNPRHAVRNWLKRNPERLDAWLKSVAIHGSAPGNAAVKAGLAN